MRLLLILLLVAWIGVSIGCTKDESYKTREADPALLNSDPGDVAPSDPSLSGGAPDEAKPDEAKPDEAKPDEAKPDEAKPDEAAKKE